MFTAYVKARSVLPNPNQSPTDVFIVSIGDEPGVDFDVHIEDFIPTAYFIFILKPDSNQQLNCWQCMDEDVVLNLNDNRRMALRCIMSIMN